jgi:glycerol uptake facilitator-like aquaporin
MRVAIERPDVSLPLKLAAEFLGTALLVAVVVGSGHMVDAIIHDTGVALLINQLATILALGVLVALLMPISGAQINPAVTLAMMIRRKMSMAEGLLYVVVQIPGAVVGTIAAQAMFDLPLIELSTRERITPGTFLGEMVATVGLIALILTALYQGKDSWLPLLVPAWIGAGYFFTSSTSFANPAVTIGRTFTESFSAISWDSAPWFIAAQVVGVFIALALVAPFERAYLQGEKQ